MAQGHGETCKNQSVCVCVGGGGGGPFVAGLLHNQDTYSAPWKLHLQLTR